jgi:hypothetical protein
MRKCVIIVILALVLTLMFATPAFANNGNGPGNMPDETADHLLNDVVGPHGDTCSLGFGNQHGKGIANWGYPLAYGINVARHNIGYDIATLGEPPAGF